MFGSEILEVAIGLILVFLLVSVICSAIREGIEAWLKTRASYLEHGIRTLLNDLKGEGLAKALYDHPLVNGLFFGPYEPGNPGSRAAFSGRNLPSYIPSKNFAEALMDIAARGPNPTLGSSGPAAGPITFESIRANIAVINNAPIQRAILSALDSAQGDLEKAKKNLEAWYDSGMDRVSGWYKRSTQWVILAIGLVVAVGLNINAITIADFLYRNDAERAAIVKEAEGIVRAEPPTDYNQAKEALNKLSLPIGWTAGGGAPHRKGELGYDEESFWNGYAAPVLGWLIVAFAATMGAPFWFDLLNKFMVIRSTVKPHEKSPEEGSEDRQTKTETETETEPPPPPPAADGAPPDAPLPAPTSPLPEFENIPGQADPEEDVDACDASVDKPTKDEDLPPAEGGVA